MNRLRSSRIYAGSRLIIRETGHKVASNTKYRVRRGDNLNVIARKFRTSVRKIKKINNLKGSLIYAGQILKVRTRG